MSKPPPPPTLAHHDQLLLRIFSEECKKMFYSADPAATQSVEQIIQSLPAGSKATFTKQMALVRSQFHRDAATSRRAAIDRLLLDTLPNSVVSKAVGHDHSLSAMRSARARQERLDQTRRFISNHCVRNMVGVHPFFGSLCAVLHLLSLPARKGGAGKRRVEWDIDLAVFGESGGNVFLKDSIVFLKGVLGFEDHLKVVATPSLKTNSFYGSNPESDLDSEDEDGGLDVVIGHVDGDDGLTLEERQELEVDQEEEAKTVSDDPESADQEEEGPFADSPVTRTLPTERSVLGDSYSKGKLVHSRSESDPFSDPMEQGLVQEDVSCQTPKRTSYCPVNQPSPLITVSLAEDVDPKISMVQLSSKIPSPPRSDQHSCSSAQPLSSFSPLCAHDGNDDVDEDEHVDGKGHGRQEEEPSNPQAEIRVFRSPSFLTTPELHDLIACFPIYIAVRSKGGSGGGVGYAGGGAGGYAGAPHRAPHTHGTIRISVFEKDKGWKGSFLERVKVLVYRMFGIWW